MSSRTDLKQRLARFQAHDNLYGPIVDDKRAALQMRLARFSLADSGGAQAPEQTADVSRVAEPEPLKGKYYGKEALDMLFGQLQANRRAARKEGAFGRGVDKWTPDWVKQAYNTSMTGLAHEIVFGEQAFDLSGYEPKVQEDIAATVLSFFMPLDMMTLKAGTMIGKGVTAMTAPRVSQKLINLGMNPKVVQKVVGTAASGTVSASGLGAYDAGRATLEGEDIEGIAKRTLHGGALGFILGTSGALSRPLAKYGAPGDLGRVGVEIGAFTAGGAALEGRLPNIDDLEHATGMVLGLKGAHAITGAIGRAIKERFAERLFRDYMAADGKKSIQDIAKEYAESEDAWNSFKYDLSEEARTKLDQIRADTYVPGGKVQLEPGKKPDELTEIDRTLDDLKASEDFERLRKDLEAATGQKYTDDAVVEHIQSAGGIPEAQPDKPKRPKPERPPAAAKQPWEMTVEEYLEGRTGSDEISIGKIGHAKAVRRAVEEGKDVPMHVLRQYRNNQWALDAMRGEAHAQKQRRKVGENYQGNPIFLDDAGNRYILDNNVRISAPRPLGPDYQQAAPYTPEKLYKDNRIQFLTKEELGRFEKGVAGPTEKPVEVGQVIKSSMAGPGGEAVVADVHVIDNVAYEFYTNPRVYEPKVAIRIRDLKGKDNLTITTYPNFRTGYEKYKETLETLGAKPSQALTDRLTPMGPELKPEATGRPKPVEAPEETWRPDPNAGRTLVEHFLDAVKQGRAPKTPAELVKMAREFDREITSDKDNDRIYDAYEAAIAREYNDRVNRRGYTFKERLDIAQELEESLPARRRSLAQGELNKQQFSTPLTLAEGMFQAAKPRLGEMVYEPTLGTGNLLAPFDRTRGRTAKDQISYYANELDPSRANLGSRALNFDLPPVTQKDYLKIKPGGHDIPYSPHVIVTNPPWGTSARSKLAKANKLPDLAAKFVNKNMEDLQDGGRLVALLPTTVIPGENQFAARWLSRLAKQYDVKALIMSPPGSYTKGRGTSVNSVMLVVDKRPPPDVGSAPVIRLSDTMVRNKPMLKSLESTMAWLRKEFPTGDIAELPKSWSWKHWQESIDRIGKRADITTKGGDLDVARPEERPAGVPGLRPEVGESSPPDAVRPAGGRPTGSPADTKPATPKPVRGQAPAQTDVVPGEQPAVQPPVEGNTPAARPTKRVERGGEGEVDSPIFTRFVPQYPGRSGNPHPRKVVMTKGSVAAGLPDVSDVKVSEDVLKLNRDAKLSDEQLEFVVRGEAALDKGHGFLQGHDVGVGKTHVAMGHVVEWFNTGKAKTVLYLTKGAQNIQDVILEWNELNDGKFPYRVVNVAQDYGDASKARTKRDTDIPRFENVVYFLDAYNYANFHDKIKQVGFDALIADESHQFRNPSSQRGAVWVDLHKQLLKNPKSRIVYMSATPGREVEEMAYLYGLREWGIGEFDIWKAKAQGHKVSQSTAAAVIKDFENTLEGSLSSKIGKGARRTAFTARHAEQIVRELVAKGKMLTTDLFRDGVEFDVPKMELTKDETKTLDQAVELLRDAEALFHEYKRDNEKIKNVFGPAAGIQSLAKELQFNMRLSRAIERAKEAVANGEQPVISLIRVAGEDLGKGAENLDLDRKSGLPKTLTNIIEMINTRKVEVTEEGEAIDHGAIDEAVMKKAEMYERAHEVWPKLPHPIEQLKAAFGENNVAIVTGSYTKVERDAADRPVVKRVTVSPRQRMLHTREFQEGKRKVMVISGAGKTGISAHDVNNARRHMIETDPEWGADTFKQALGRVDRSGQLSSPKISFITLGLAGERKFVGTIANRMRDLGAAAKGAASSTGTERLDSFEYGDQLSYTTLRETWERMSREQRMLFTGLKTFRGVGGEPTDRLESMDYNTMQQFWRILQTAPVKVGEEIQRIYEDTYLEVEVDAARAELNRLRKEGLSDKQIQGYLNEIEQGRPWQTIRQERHETGELLREARLNDDLMIHEVKARDGHRYGIVSGLITDNVQDLAEFVGRKPNGMPDLYYQDFNFVEGGGVSGLRVPYMRIRPLAEAYKAEGFGSKVTLKNLKQSLGAGDKAELANGWTIHLGQRGEREGKYVVTGPKMSEVVHEVGGEKRLRYGLQYHPAGFYFVEDPAVFAKKFGLKSKKADVVDPNVDTGTSLGMTFAPTGPNPLSRNVQFRNLLERSLAKHSEERERLPEVMFGDEPRDVGMRRYFLTPSFVLGAIPGMPAKFGPRAQSAARQMLLTEFSIKIEQRQRQEHLDRIVKNLDKADVGKYGEKLWDGLFEGVPKEDILKNPDISQRTRWALLELREFFDNDRQDHIKTVRGQWSEWAFNKATREIMDSEGVSRRIALDEYYDSIRERSEEFLDEIMPRDWGLRDYLPHLHPGDYRISVEYADGTTEYVTSAKNKIGALAKIADDYPTRNEEKRVVSYSVNKRLFKDPDVVRVGSPRYHMLAKELSTAAEVSPDEVKAAMAGKIGKRASRKKHFFAFKQRKGYLGYTKNLREVLTAYNLGFVRSKHLTELNARIQPLIEGIAKEGRPRTKAYVETIFNQLWGYQSDLSRSVDAGLQRLRYVRDRIMPMALDRWMGALKAASFNLFLRGNPRFHALNRMQTYQTLAPLVSVGDFWEGTRLYNSKEGKDLLQRYGVRYVTGGKQGEAGVDLSKRSRLREKARGFAPETFNQEKAWLTMYAEARKQGLNEKAAADYAFLRGNLFSQFTHLSSDKPLILRGPLASTIFQYKRFSIKNMELGWTLLRSKDMPGLGKWLGAQMLLGGAKAFDAPFTAPLKTFGKGYIPYQLYKQIAGDDNEDQWLADFVFFGLPGLIGMDLSYSIDMIDIPFGETVPEQVGNLLMGPIGNVTYGAFRAAGDTKGTVESPVERSARNLAARLPALRWMLSLEALAKGADEGKYSMRGSSGKLQFKSDLKDVLLYGVGGRPVERGRVDVMIDAFDDIRSQRDAIMDKFVQRWINSGEYPIDDDVNKRRQEWNVLWPEWSIRYDALKRRKDTRERTMKKTTPERVISKGGEAVLEEL